MGSRETQYSRCQMGAKRRCAEKKHAYLKQARARFVNALEFCHGDSPRRGGASQQATGSTQQRKLARLERGVVLGFWSRGAYARSCRKSGSTFQRTSVPTASSARYLPCAEGRHRDDVAAARCCGAVPWCTFLLVGEHLPNMGRYMAREWPTRRSDPLAEAAHSPTLANEEV